MHFKFLIWILLGWTDLSFYCNTTSPIVFTGLDSIPLNLQLRRLYDGEAYDSRANTRFFTDSSGTMLGEEEGYFISDNFLPIIVHDTIQPKIMYTIPGDYIILDMGQNMVGRLQFQVEGPRGTTVVLEHSEVLDKDGNWYNKNLRTAKQRIEYTLAGNGVETYTPQYTYMGFRYVRIRNYPGVPKLSDFKGLVMHADIKRTGHFVCGDSLVNRLYENIIWSQRGNYQHIPTDCPQRDERLGWTGDVQIFGRTAAYNYDVLQYFKNWLKLVREYQEPSGNIPWTIPPVISGDGAAGWGDVTVLLPWDLYLMYGDTTVLKEQYKSMCAWVDHRVNTAGEDYLIRDAEEFGDWLAYEPLPDGLEKPGYTDHDYIATAYLAHSADILARISRILGRQEEAKYYQQVFEQARTAFQEEYITGSGRLSPNTQTAYVLALYFNLVPNELEEKAVDYLVDNIEARGMHLSTGYLGTRLINEVLTKQGRSDIAYQLLLQKTYPSWLYPVTKGATTIWERWDGIRPDGTFGSDFMNSFNHTPFGAVGQWLYGSVLGIRPVEDQPGFRHIQFSPIPNAELGFASGSFDTQHGTIKSNWSIEGDSCLIEVFIPKGCTGELVLPTTALDTISLNEGAFAIRIPYETKINDIDWSKVLFQTIWFEHNKKESIQQLFPELQRTGKLAIMSNLSIERLRLLQPEIFTNERLASLQKILNAETH
jgi:alpha-L-rhamnosidase